MGAALVVFAGTRLLIRMVLRLHYLPPKAILTQLGPAPYLGPDETLLRTGDLADATGHLASSPRMRRV
jgi:hypothetical protein